MVSGTCTESIIKGAALAWFEALGCAVLLGPDIASGQLSTARSELSTDRIHQ